jgi:hypothetical protein
MYFRRFELVEAVRGRTAGYDLANAEAVAHTIRQAREYFASAAMPHFSQRPVLLHYGMVPLAKLLLLLHDTEPLGIQEIESFERQGPRPEGGRHA